MVKIICLPLWPEFLARVQTKRTRLLLIEKCQLFSGPKYGIESIPEVSCVTPRTGQI